MFTKTDWKNEAAGNTCDSPLAKGPQLIAPGDVSTTYLRPRTWIFSFPGERSLGHLDAKRGGRVATCLGRVGLRCGPNGIRETYKYILPSPLFKQYGVAMMSPTPKKAQEAARLFLF